MTWSLAAPHGKRDTRERIAVQGGTREPPAKTSRSRNHCSIGRPVRLELPRWKVAARIQIRKLRTGVGIHVELRACRRIHEPSPGLVECVEPGDRRADEPRRRRHHKKRPGPGSPDE